MSENVKTYTIDYWFSGIKKKKRYSLEVRNALEYYIHFKLDNHHEFKTKIKITRNDA